MTVPKGNIRMDLVRLEKESEIDLEFIAIEAGDREASPADRERHRELRTQRGRRFHADMLFVLTHRFFEPEQAEGLWKNILEHKESLNHALARNVGIAVAALDYLTNIRDMLIEPSVVASSKLTTVAEIAVKDGLTGLYDHSTFCLRLAEEIQRATRYEQSLSLLMMDADRFKRFNDENGHRAGDRVLARIAAAIQQEIREIDAAARYGGEEFAVIAPSTGLEEAFKLAERIRGRIKKDLCAESVTISAGVATLCIGTSNAEDLIVAADRALYRSKQDGRDRAYRAEAP